MSDRIFRTEKVDKIIGINEKKFDKIEIFSERINSNNLFGIAYYKEFVKGKEVTKRELVRFANYEKMMKFLKYNFDTYELDHYVRDDLKHIFFHYADYLGVDYYLHDGKPDKNYVVFKYREYANNTFYSKQLKFPKELEKILLEITNRSRPVKEKSLHSRTVDVNEERKINRTENIQKYTRIASDLLKLSGEKLRGTKDNQPIVRKLKVIIAGTALASLLTTGVILVKDNIVNSDFLEQENSIKNPRDVSIYVNKGHAGVILEKLMQEKYDEVTSDELDFVLNFIYTVDDSNYDKNDSYNIYSLDKYFDHYLFNREKYDDLHKMLDKIERLYRRIFVVENNNLKYNVEEAKEYIDYVSSFTFMYDTYHKTRPTDLVPLYNNNIDANLKNVSDIELYDSLPPILKIVILNQLKGVIAHIDYKVTNKPAYYFKGFDKYDLLGEIKDRLVELEDELLFNCTITNKTNIS